MWNLQEFEIGRKVLIQACVEYCDILRYEFLFSKPCQQLNDLLDDAFDRLKTQNVLALPAVSCNFPLHLFFFVLTGLSIFSICVHFQDQLISRNPGYNRIPRAYIDTDSSDSDDNQITETEDRFILPSEGHDKRLVLMSVLTPYSHTYLAVTHSLPHLLHCMLPESTFVRLCIDEITRAYENAECKYGKCPKTIGFFDLKFI